MNYGDLRTFDVANGKGIRVSLFVSGCTNYCKGCFNEEAQDFNFGKKFDNNTSDFIIHALQDDLHTGLSLLGGDPLEEANRDEVLKLILKVRKEFYDKKDIWLWTGKTYEEIISDDDSILKTIIFLCDVLIDGRFIEELKNPTLMFRGSSNQRIIDTQKTLLDKEYKIHLWNDGNYR